MIRFGTSALTMMGSSILSRACTVFRRTPTTIRRLRPPTTRQVLSEQLAHFQPNRLVMLQPMPFLRQIDLHTHLSQHQEERVLPFPTKAFRQEWAQTAPQSLRVALEQRHKIGWRINRVVRL